MSVRESLIHDTVSSLDIHPDTNLISPFTTVRTIVQQLKERKRGCVLIGDHDSVQGIFTERDLLLRVFGRGRSLDIEVQEVMTPNPVTVHLDDSVADAVKKMRNGGYRHIPVVHRDGRPVGVLSVKHIVHFLVDHFPEDVYNLSPDPDSAFDTPEGA